ncbi:hypothetical protein NYZ99_07315 [Maribacter litopenaei]|uniref:TupA-like ATPgrasp n=1 Tax=Maribacter litopenaei TaxID=2976127 RepID=A0ABY5YB54_9FLAO|nr:ATP-grasp fold amidoligase family protein [Maribacter litopenaei]UWX56103.1 hypothetical protein NYZ99_07315 [Maribacter litopenaei]
MWRDKWVIKYNFWKSRQKSLNLKNPQTLNEKINWLKLYDRRPIQTQCADKYEVRKYVEERIGEDYLVPLYFQTTNPDELIPENIPDIPCIIKANHDSSGGVFVHDKDTLDYAELRNNFKKRLKKNYYHSNKEWQYKNIVPELLSKNY